jgi:hypothetical protein
MIRLPFDAMVGYGIMGAIGWVVAQWTWRSVRQRAWVPPFDRSWMWQCAVCTYLFVDSRAGSEARCPRCQSWTERGAASRKGGEAG